MKPIEISLDMFKPRSYQLPIFEAIEHKGYKRAIVILPRRARQGPCMLEFDDKSLIT